MWPTGQHLDTLVYHITAYPCGNVTSFRYRVLQTVPFDILSQPVKCSSILPTFENPLYTFYIIHHSLHVYTLQYMLRKFRYSKATSRQLNKSLYSFHDMILMLIQNRFKFRVLCLRRSMVIMFLTSQFEVKILLNVCNIHKIFDILGVICAWTGLLYVYFYCLTPIFETFVSWVALEIPGQ